MNRLQPTSPVLVMLYGFPGAGKTYLARQLASDLSAAHVQDNRIRCELFEAPRYDKQENAIVHQLMQYMTVEFLNAGVSVIYDTNAMRQSQRLQLRELARKSKAKPLLIWLQIDPESAWIRANKRDKRKTDDRYSEPIDQASFERILGTMQNPVTTEDYVVVSGKHTYQTQRGALLKKMFDLGLVDSQTISAGVAKPGMVNLIPNPVMGRVDFSRRNIVIR